MPTDLPAYPAACTLAETTRWIWDHSDPDSAEARYLQVRREFVISPAQAAQIALDGHACLRIFAAHYFQVWINGVCLGHGPAKAPHGEAFVDTHDLSAPGLLTEGSNTLEILVHANGAGTMIAPRTRPGIVFEIRLPDAAVISSDAQTLIRTDARRRTDTARRWLLPNIEEVDAAASPDPWVAATLISSELKLLHRPVPLASRRILCAEKIIAADAVQMPDFCVSFRLKPCLADASEQYRCNLIDAAAIVVTDLLSDIEQTVTFLPATGHIAWYFNQERIALSNGWERWQPQDSASDTGTEPRGVRLHLKAGSNRLIGIHRKKDHFESVHIAAFCQSPLRVSNPFGKGGFQIIPISDAELANSTQDWFDFGAHLPHSVTERIEAGPFPAMNPAHTMVGANPQERVVNAVQINQCQPPQDTSEPAYATAHDGSGRTDAKGAAYTDGANKAGSTIHTDGANNRYTLPALSQPLAYRLVLDLGAVQNGHLCFSAFGCKGSVLTFSFSESVEPGAPFKISYPGACNNTLVYRLKDGWQQFESLLPYGVRYVCIHHEGEAPVRLRNLHFTAVHCGNLPMAAIRTGDAVLDAIHAICEQTLVAATDNTLTDCPTYEMVNWNFDNRLGTIADLTTCRSIALLRNTIEQYTRDPEYPALVRSHTPSTWEVRIPVFSFHWILLCRDYYTATADKGFLCRVWPQVQSGIEEALGMIDPRLDLFAWQPWDSEWHLVDWAQGRDDLHKIVSAEQALLIGALEAAEQMAGELHGDKAAERIANWKHTRLKLKAAVERHLWVGQADAFADSLHEDGSRSPLCSQVSNAALALYGIGTEAWQQRLQQRIRTQDPSLPPFGSPMGLFYVLEFLDSREDADAIFRIIRDKWEAMLLAGDKTAWEQFPEYTGNPKEPTRSRCHPFATYILRYYTKYLLGITFSAPQQKSIRFAPNAPAGINAVQGALPVADGWIRVSWERTDTPDGHTTYTSKRIETPASVNIEPEA